MIQIIDVTGIFALPKWARLVPGTKVALCAALVHPEHDQNTYCIELYFKLQRENYDFLLPADTVLNENEFATPEQSEGQWERVGELVSKGFSLHDAYAKVALASIPKQWRFGADDDEESLTAFYINRSPKEAIMAKISEEDDISNFITFAAER